MPYKISLALLVIIISLFLVAPKTAAAFWWFSQKKTVTITAPAPSVLSDQDKLRAEAKYKIFDEAFEKKNVEIVIANQDKFLFTITELNYLFTTESKKAKNPTLTNVGLTSDNGNINVTADFHKFINGRFSFITKIVSVDNKIRLQLSVVKLYGIRIPAGWLEGPVNNTLDDYFSFLYNDNRYQGFTFSNDNNLIQFKPSFKK